jgi:phosphoserine phosphatase RsbU/P
MWNLGTKALLTQFLALGLGSAAPICAQAAAPPVTIEGLGRGLVHLDQPWQFHAGDDSSWAGVAVQDDTGQGGWEAIRPDRPWGAQGHYAYSGFAWYRIHLRQATAAEKQATFHLVLPGVSDVCEVYWNGVFAGRYGTMPPHPSWPAVNAPADFTLSGPPNGTLALRVWLGPLGSSSTGEVGGLLEAPILGDEESVADYIGTWNYQFLRATLFASALNLLYLVVGIAGTILWLRHRKDPLLLWFSIFAVCPAIWNSIYTMRLPVSSQSAQLVLQPLWQLRNIAIWFLLIYLLNLEGRSRIVGWAKYLAGISLSAAFVDGCLVYVPTTWLSAAGHAWIDGVITVIAVPCNLYLVVLVAFAFGRRLDSVRWVLVGSACLSQLLAVTAAIAMQGQRFTRWTLGQKLYSPLFHVGPVDLGAQSLLDLLVFFSILYAIYRYILEQRTRQATLEQELESARELQEVLIPEKPPALPGYSISSAYRPALEVGGDFFQVIPLEGEYSGSTLIVLGDVSGKGLRAAMAVSLIIGTVRTLAESTPSPARILVGLNRRLCGRLKDGFTTCVAMRLDPGGHSVVATAGHPAPYLNGRAIDLPGALPLGIDPEIVYEEFKVGMSPGDRCTLYTDGLLEARAASGEIFSFERLDALLATNKDAASATAAAVDFGQEDDITVLTLTRAADA